MVLERHLNKAAAVPRSVVLGRNGAAPRAGRFTVVTVTLRPLRRSGGRLRCEAAGFLLWCARALSPTMGQRERRGKMGPRARRKALQVGRLHDGLHAALSDVMGGTAQKKVTRAAGCGTR